MRSVNWARLHAGRDRQGRARLYATMGQEADNLFVLQIDPETGKCRQFLSKVPRSNYPTATLISRDGKLYVGAAYAGHLLCFDPAKDELADLGPIHRGAASFPCRMDEDAAGRVWIGSYPAADLTCYDPKTGQFTRHGRMDDVDMYNYPLVADDGTVACLIRMTRPHVVVFDPAKGTKQLVGPMTTKGKETIDLQKGKDGKLYIRSSVGNFRIDRAGKKGDSPLLPERPDHPSGGARCSAQKGTVPFFATPVDAIPGGPPGQTLPGGATFRFTDAAEQTCRKLEIRSSDGEVRKLQLDYEAAGSGIFCLHAGPDGCLYGSSILPEHLFRYDPKTGELDDLGRCSRSAGEAYSMATLAGKVYISSYPRARLSVYDPAKPYHFGTAAGDNPRDLGPIDEISYRPRSTLAGPLGRVWLASVPDYGRWGGPLSYYDPATGKRHAYYRIAGDGSCYTLAHLADQRLIAVGTSISGGSGTRPKVDQAVLFLWEYGAEKKAWEGTLDRPVSAFNALVAGPDGRLYGTAVGGKKPELFVFDPKTRKFAGRLALPAGSPLDLGLSNGPDGMIYGFTSGCVYRLDPTRLGIKEVLRAPGGIGIAGPIMGREIYFATGHRLRAATILP